MARYAIVESLLVNRNNRWIADTVIALCQTDLELLGPIDVKWFEAIDGARRHDFQTPGAIGGRAQNWATILLNMDLSTFALVGTAAHECRHIYQFQQGLEMHKTRNELEADARHYVAQGKQLLREHLAKHQPLFYGATADYLRQVL